MEIKYSFKPNEVIKDFKLIGETFKLGSNLTKTGKGRRMYKSLISDKGLDKEAEEIIDKAKYAYSHGLVNDTVLTLKQIEAMKLLVIYCVGL